MYVIKRGEMICEFITSAIIALDLSGALVVFCLFLVCCYCFYYFKENVQRQCVTESVC